jgi:hypothetical protein
MNEKIYDIIARIQVKYNLTTESRLDPIFKELALLTVKECVDICEERVKAYDVAGNEYNVIRNHSQELCVKALKDQFSI